MFQMRSIWFLVFFFIHRSASSSRTYISAISSEFDWVSLGFSRAQPGFA